jgi:hypothetical protein
MDRLLAALFLLVCLSTVKSQTNDEVANALDALLDGYDNRFRPNYGGE